MSFESSEPFDCVISAFSIHHLEDQAKQNLYERIFKLLKPGGVFVCQKTITTSSKFYQRVGFATINHIIVRVIMTYQINALRNLFTRT
ncbi:class I SAM-dependent methyltransferase [Paenibacillus sp. yr247]|uniref:class I SAM-dependent methyltransferase n=1 Tax=Paenibacillus sp. yr247 TaxID=1761880 RepID=UPI000B89B057